ncbi:MAG: hypothetical protein A3G81_03895 [Betaproteobacteria bacterium RIFCSPLOWO2_12_FULL_65_14]|nr:MAG: hypothetical protein A3G81_03895 [Betaproteobacteria bacterium RIFCSPLOWO2_12_FULL_65_14]
MSGKPVPVPDADSRPFWDGCREHQLRIERCADCGTARFPPSGMCPHCRSSRREWITASGRGTVFSWIVVRHPVPKEMYAGEVPYVVALVELEEGVRMPTNIVGCEPGAIRAGMPVEVVFEDVSADVTLPRFRPQVPS